MACTQIALLCGFCVQPPFEGELCMVPKEPSCLYNGLLFLGPYILPILRAQEPTIWVTGLLGVLAGA